MWKTKKRSSTFGRWKRNSMSSLVVILIGLALVSVGQSAWAAVWYVDAGYIGTEDGTSWVTPYNTIQEAVAAASNVIPDEIWVKQGTYSLSSQITVNKPVEIYGGFDGTETARDQRDWKNNVTTVDGQNSVYHCFYITADATDATVDGFTITGGNANGSSAYDWTGGGIFNDASSLIANCIISNNSADRSGGGICNYTTANTTWPPNVPLNSPTIKNCTFTGNIANWWGGGIYNQFSTPNITNCAFFGNSVITNGGGGISNSAASPTITNCTFYGNSATTFGGGGIANDTRCDGTTITNCILWGDTATSGPAEIYDSQSDATVTYCDVEGGYTGTGNINAGPDFVDAPNGDFHLNAGSPCIDAGINTAVINATDLDGAPRIIDGDNDSMPTVDMGAYEYQAMMWTLVTHLGGSYCVSLQYVGEDQYRLSCDTANLVYEGLYAAETGDDVLITYLVMTEPDYPAYNGFVWESTNGTLSLIQHCYVNLCCYGSCGNCDEGIPCCYLPATMTLGCVADLCAPFGGDTDGDGVCDDGDGSGTVGDNPCISGSTSDCDDNCRDVANANQADFDGDGIGDVCDPCPGDLENDADKDTLCGDVDPCPYDYPKDVNNPHGADTDQDGRPDDCDNCPDRPNFGSGGTCVRYEGDPKYVAEIGGPCSAVGDCPDTGTGWECSQNQEDTNNDLQGDACQFLDLRVSPITDPYRPGQDIPVTVTIENISGQPQQIIRPKCYSCGPGPLFTVLDKDGIRLRQNYRIGPAIVLPDDVITLSSSISITCNIAPMFPDLTDPDPGDGNPEIYTVHATLSNALEHAESGLGPYVYTTDTQDLQIEGTPAVNYVASVIFDPAQWYAHWAVSGSGPQVSALITSENFDVNDVDPSTIVLNGSVPITGSDPVSNGVLTVRFNGPAAVQSFGSAFGGQVTAVVQGEVENDFFRAEGLVQLKGNLVVRCHEHRVGCGTYPDSGKYPIKYAPVRIYDKSTGTCAANYGISWQHWPDIWNGVGTTNPRCDYQAQAETDENGEAWFALPAGDWLIIALYDKDGNPDTVGDRIYMGRSAGDFTGGSLMQKYIQVIEKCDKEKVPGKGKKLGGSELWIIEPEYVEWSGESELYPFVFESIGDWAVTTSVAPPEGFVADYESLTEEVNTEIEALQFTITDVGSKWKPTKVKHKIKHKGKEQTIESEIGVMLTSDLAKKKRVSIYGDEDKDEDKDKD